MKIYLITLIILLICIGLSGLFTGSIWMGGKFYNRGSSKMDFYVGILAYLIIALFTYLFGREIW